MVAAAVTGASDWSDFMSAEIPLALASASASWSQSKEGGGWI